MKTRVVLGYIASESHRGRVAFGEGEDALSVTFLDLAPGAWEDMGRPTAVTVTVEPGNRLNDGGDQ